MAGIATIASLLDRAQRPRLAGWLYGNPEIDEDENMSDAQFGLLAATPIIISFAGALRAMGVLSTTATVCAIGLSIAIAVVLFTTQ